MGRLKVLVEQESKAKEEYNKTPEGAVKNLKAEMRRLEIVGKSDLVDEKERARLRVIWLVLKKELDEKTKVISK